MESATSPTGPPPSFHSGDSDSLGEYHSLSGLAIFSVVLGLASPLCFAGPLLLAIPVVGVAISLIALQRIAASEGSLIGRAAAITGLALSIASAIAYFSFNQANEYLRERQAATFGRQWIEYLQIGDVQTAFRLTRAGAEPEPPEEGAGPKKPNAFESFSTSPIVQQIVAVGGASTIRAGEIDMYSPNSAGNCVVRQMFTVTPASTSAAAPASQPIRILLTMQRARLGAERMPRWLVVVFKQADAGETPVAP